MNNQLKLYPIPQSITVQDEKIPMPSCMLYQEDKSNAEKLTLASQKRIEDLNHLLSEKDEEKTSQSSLPIVVQKIAKPAPAAQKEYYTLAIREDAISIEAASKEAIYYALTSLYQLINESEDNLPLVEIEDYPSVRFRGLVEGFYGIPYTIEKRESIMDFASYLKMNCYVYAPKDDPYHRDLWWELYPEKELAELSRQAHFGESRNIHFVYTLSPFKPDANPITEANQEEGLAQVIQKFEQLYDAGIRQFGIQGDDVGKLPYETVIFVMNALNRWRKEKGDVEDLFYCPQGYTLAEWSFGDGTEANLMDKGLDADIHIFYTGVTTCSVLDKAAIEGWKTFHLPEGEKERRAPLFWMNWPVNDIDRETYRRLFLGKGEVYEKDAGDVVGVLTNPMEEAEASKVALFATLDYAWNTKAFEQDQSWKDSFSFIEENASEDLAEIAKHMSGIANGAKADAEESNDLLPFLENLDSFTNLTEDEKEKTIQSLASKMEEITSACQNFLGHASNALLLEEMQMYVKTLEAKAKASIYYCKAILASGADDAKEQTREESIKQATAARESIKKNLVHTRTAEFPSTSLIAEAGMKVINPILVRLEKLAS